MGKGDKKSRRGKIANGSYGARRPRKAKKVAAPAKKKSAKKTKK
jgi:30S ribosomal protein S31